MTKKNKMVLKGHLTAPPDWGFNYAKTRDRITGKLLSFSYSSYGNDNTPFRSVIEFEVKEEGDFEVTLRVSPNFMAKDRSDGTKEETALCNLLSGIQEHCGIGSSNPEEKESGVMDIAYLSGLKYEDE